MDSNLLNYGTLFRGSFSLEWKYVEKGTTWEKKRLIKLDKFRSPKDYSRSLKYICREKMVQKINRNEKYILIGGSCSKLSRTSINLYYKCSCWLHVGFKLTTKLYTVKKKSPMSFYLIKTKECDCGKLLMI